jgi:hypothetical protein
MILLVLWRFSSIRSAIRRSSYFPDDSCFPGYMNDLVTVDVHNPIGVVFVCFVFHMEIMYHFLIMEMAVSMNE